MFCNNCGTQLKEGSRFCMNCGTNLMSSTDQSETAMAGHHEQTPSVPPPIPTDGRSVYIGMENFPAKSSGKKKMKGCMIGAGIFAAVIIAFIVTLTLFNTGKTFSNLSEQEQETLMANLYERLDQHFVSDLQIEKQLAQLLVYEDETMSFFFDNIDKKALEKEGQDIGFKVGIELMEIAQKWASDNKIDFDNWANNINSEDLLVEYMSHLIQIASEEAEIIIQEMKTTLREEFDQEVSEDDYADNADTADYDWIVGDWMNSETYHEITFTADGLFSTGDDCSTTGTFTIQENTVHLNGITVCPDCDDCEESEYHETMTIKEKTLEGYKKTD